MTSTAGSSGNDWTPEVLTANVQREFDRNIARSIKGLEFVASAPLELGITPKDILYRRGSFTLYHYRASTDEIYRVPILLVASLVSKYYIMDLAPGQSLIEYLIDHGHDVYLLDWGVPRPEDARLRFEDYVLDFIPDCLDRVADDSGVGEVSIGGYCLGGVLAALYAAVNDRHELKNLLCMASPVDFEHMGLFKQWTDPKHFDVDRIVAGFGNVPAEVVLQGFNMLRPVSKFTDPVKLWDNLWNDDFIESYRRIDQWSNDQIPIAGECFRQLIKLLMQQNLLVQGRFELGGRRVDLGRVEIPAIHILAQHDHVVPYDAGKALIPALGSSDKEEVVLKGGHASLVAGRNALHRLWPKIDAWLSTRSV